MIPRRVPRPHPLCRLVDDAVLGVRLVVVAVSGSSSVFIIFSSMCVRHRARRVSVEDDSSTRRLELALVALCRSLPREREKREQARRACECVMLRGHTMQPYKARLTSLYLADFRRILALGLKLCCFRSIHQSVTKVCNGYGHVTCHHWAPDAAPLEWCRWGWRVRPRRCAALLELRSLRCSTPLFIRSAMLRRLCGPPIFASLA